MKVLVGSKNPNKIAAVREAFEDIFGNVEVEGINIKSAVNHTPQNQEILEGAMHRARELIDKYKCDYAVGIEGGILELHDKRFLTGYTIIIDKKNRIGRGLYGFIELPPTVLDKVDRGIELGNIASELAGEENVKQKQGIIGFLTNDTVPRGLNQKISVYIALSRFLHPELW